MNVGDVIDGAYRLEARIGSGAFGEVWRATQLGLGREVALKILKTREPEAQQRFSREARALASIEHPRCVRVYDIATTASGVSYLSMELVRGKPLAASRGEHRSVREVGAIVTQIAEALAAAHRVAVAHRDLKPENVMVVGDGEGVEVKVLDFGLAKTLDPDQTDITRSGEVFGTPQYMSPEQFRGAQNVGPPTDVYALGVIMYELLTGKLPFGAREFMQLGMAHTHDAPPDIDRSDVPAAWTELLRRMLAKAPHDRPTAAEVSVALSARGVPTAAVVVAAVAVVLAVVGGLVVLAGDTDEPPVEPPTPIVLRPSTPPLTPTEASVKDAADLRVEVPTEDGCGTQRPAGYQRAAVMSHLTSAEVLLRLPPTYDGQKRHPVVLLFGRSHLPGDLGDDGLATRLESLADESGFILASPRFPGNKTDVEITLDIVDWIQRELCVDRAHLYAIGRGTGGDFARELRCVLDLSAIVTIESAESEDACPQVGVPYLRIYGEQDDFMPAAGGVGCSGTFTLSAIEIEQVWRKRNAIQGEGRAWGPPNGGACKIWRGEASFASCSARGGHYLLDDAPKRTFPSCEILHNGTEFPVLEAAWTFLVEEGRSVSDSE